MSKQYQILFALGHISFSLPLALESNNLVHISNDHNIISPYVLFIMHASKRGSLSRSGIVQIRVIFCKLNVTLFWHYHIIQWCFVWSIKNLGFLEKYFIFPSIPWRFAKSLGQLHSHVHQEILLQGFRGPFPNHSFIPAISEIATANYCGL